MLLTIIQRMSQGNATKVNKDMNTFFCKCPLLVSTHVREFYMLTCVHVHWRGNPEKDFSLYCDPSYQSMKYAGDDVSIEAPRYSGVQYKALVDCTDTHEGQVVGMISYKPRGGADCLYLLINRFVTPHVQNEYFRRSIPQRLVKYHKVGQQVTTDCVPMSQIIGPLFIVPALDYGQGFSNIGNREEVNARFYVITQSKVECSNIMEYEEYLDRNNNEFSERKGNNTPEYMNVNPFLTVTEMVNVKSMLDVYRNVEQFNSDIVEDYEFDFDDDDIDNV